MLIDIEVNEKPYLWLRKGRDKRFNYLHGGASAGKSHTVAQYLIKDKFLTEKNIGILALRKVRPAVKTSCWPLVKGWLNRMKVDYGENKTELRLTGPYGNFWIFDGLDNVFKKRSMEGINYIWIEETAAIQHDAVFTEREIIQLNIMCRAPNSNGINQLFFSYNRLDPIGNAWLKKQEDGTLLPVGTPGHLTNIENSQQLGLTHNDNPFIPKEEHDQIEILIETDVEYDKIYRLGEWAIPTNIVFSNWTTCESLPENYDQRVWGLDFGYVNPTALSELRIIENKFWLKEHIYRKQLTIPELIEMLKDIVPMTDMLVGDGARPDTIQEIRNAGFNIFASDKGKGSVWYGIKTMQAFKIYITAESDNTIKEFSGYKWREDAKGDVMEEPVKFLDHIIDGTRYALTKIVKRVKAGLLMVGEKEPEVDDMFERDEVWS